MDACDVLRKSLFPARKHVWFCVKEMVFKICVCVCVYVCVCVCVT